MVRSGSGEAREDEDLRILIDTSSWLHPHAEAIIEVHLLPVARRSGHGIVVPEQVLDEIEKHTHARDQLLRQNAERARALIRRYREMKLAEVFGGSEETFADNIMQVVMMRFCEKYHFCFVTQDRDLAADALRIEQRRSVRRGKSIFAGRVGQHGSFDRWWLDGRGYAVWDEMEPPPRRVTPAPSFKIYSGDPITESSPLAIRSAPAVNETVYDERQRPFKLTRVVGSGGEATVFATDDNAIVCKIYDDMKRTTLSRQKLELMLRRPIQHPSICWPRALAFNMHREYVGFFMPAAPGKELQRSVFIKPLLEQTHPQWSRLHLAQLLLSVLDGIDALHASNILLGDINPRNILVQDERTVSFIDVDSYQVDRFSCPVGTATFLAPDLLGKKLNNVLRTMDQELFAVATLAFMILVPGKPPYSHQGGGDPAENVRTRHFPYSLGSRWVEGELQPRTKGQGVPEGPWRFIWSHFPKYLKEAFYAVFKEDARISTGEWLDIVSRYRQSLERGHASSDIFPSSFKKLRREEVVRMGGRWITCTDCREAFGSFEKNETICIDCRIKPVEVACFLCSKSFHTRRGNSVRERAPVCEQCRAFRQTERCRECQATFEITSADRVWCKQKNWSLYRRCRDCRERKRRAAAPPTPSITTPPGSGAGSFGEFALRTSPPTTPSRTEPESASIWDRLKSIFGND